jgi:hypothetical protein
VSAAGIAALPVCGTESNLKIQNMKIPTPVAPWRPVSAAAIAALPVCGTEALVLPPKRWMNIGLGGFAWGRRDGDEA